MVRQHILRPGLLLGALLLGSSLVACARGPAQPAASAASTEASPPVGLQAGQRAPDVAVTTLDGARLTSADLVAQDKPYILYFFATW